VKWDEGPNANQSTPAITRMFTELVNQPPAKTSRKAGDTAAALASAGKKIEAVYEAPFQSHAPMEPMNCTAHVRADGCDVWAPTQMQTTSRDIAAQVFRTQARAGQDSLPVHGRRLRAPRLGRLRCRGLWRSPRPSKCR